MRLQKAAQRAFQVNTRHHIPLGDMTATIYFQLRRPRTATNTITDHFYRTRFALTSPPM